MIRISLNVNADYERELTEEATQRGEDVVDYLSRLCTKFIKSRVDEGKFTRSKRNIDLVVRRFKEAPVEKQTEAVAALSLELRPNGEIVEPDDQA